MQENENTYVLIIRFLDGSITDSEKKELHLWLNQSEENKKEFLNLYRTWNLSKSSAIDFEDEESYREVWSRIKGEESKSTKRRFRLRLLISASGVAAAVILLLILLNPWAAKPENPDIATFLSQTTFSPDSIGKEIMLVVSNDKTILLNNQEPAINYEEGQIKVDEEKIISKEESASFNQLIIPYGKHSTLTLSDGTIAYVNAGSRLVYPVEFGKDKREIFVDGEVYLDVTKDKNRPFIVKTSELDVTVLGTKLNVCTYSTEIQKNVTLVSGSVKISSPGKAESILKPNQMYTLEKGEHKIETVDAMEKIAWIDGIYNFRSAKLDLVIRALEKYYGVKIDYDENVAGITFSGKLVLENELDIILQQLSKSLSFTYLQQGIETYQIKAIS